MTILVLQSPQERFDVFGSSVIELHGGITDEPTYPIKCHRVERAEKNCMNFRASNLKRSYPNTTSPQIK